MSKNFNRPRREKRVTLVEVAEDAGVSRATASLVLRGSPAVAEATRQKVFASMEKLGYVYNRAAASLRTQRSRTVGLVVTDITNPFFAQMTVGSESYLDEANYAVLLANTSEKLDKQKRLLETMNEYGVDGLLFCPAMGTPAETIEDLQRWQLPTVLVARHFFDIGLDYVGPDNVLGAKLAVAHLLALGQQRIAFVGGPVDSSARAERLKGYAAALREEKLPFDEALAVTSPVTREGGYEAILRLLRLPQPPTAAFCYNDVVAFGVMLGLQAAGLRPGSDFAVVGFDDIDEAALWRPALTSISISPRQIGREAAQLLLERISRPQAPPRQILLPPELTIRESCRASGLPNF